MGIVPVFQDFKKILLLHFRRHLEKPFVDDEEIVAGELLYNAGHAPSDFGSIIELFHKLRHAEIFDPVQMAASLFPQSTGEVGLSYSGKSVDDQVLMALNVTAAGIAKDFFTAESSSLQDKGVNIGIRIAELSNMRKPPDAIIQFY